MEGNSQILNCCPVCSDQGKRTPLEGEKDSDIIQCPIHGVMSLVFFNDIFFGGRFSPKS